MKPKTYSKEDYKTLQSAMIEMMGLKKGDTVKIMHKVESFDLGWATSWEKCMDADVGTEIVIAAISDTMGVRADFGYWFPIQSVRKIDSDPPIKVGDYDAKVLPNGDVQVGCTLVPRTLLEEIYYKSTAKIMPTGYNPPNDPSV